MTEAAISLQTLFLYLEGEDGKTHFGHDIVCQNKGETSYYDLWSNGLACCDGEVCTYEKEEDRYVCTGPEGVTFDLSYKEFGIATFLMRQR